MEDLNVLPDLRERNTERSAELNTFWEECAMFLNEDVGRAVDDRRHGQVTHLARAISIRNQVEQVKAHCASGTPIPSVEWTRLQFWPKTPATKSSLHYIGQFTTNGIFHDYRAKKAASASVSLLETVTIPPYSELETVAGVV